MKAFPTLTSFLCGVMIAASIAIFAQPRTGAAQYQGTTWQTASVDSGAIRLAIPAFIKDDDGRRVNNDRDGKTTAEVQRQKQDLLDHGFEPFSGAVYNSGIYSNEQVWFFRKRTN